MAWRSSLSIVCLNAALTAVSCASGQAATYNVDYGTALRCATRLTSFAALATQGNAEGIEGKLSKRAGGYIQTAIVRGRARGKSEATVRREYSAESAPQTARLIRELKGGSTDSFWRAVRTCLDHSGGPAG